ncbi:hypothetical protein PSACC_03175 [Paramicrosporidium saccamoebae]|uniref:HAM1-like N-terminal domain-containing protein n=1 Tax=Paramicrosporidium saccamoebae TaxID=1246581 RepID=A0A2H9THB8_9FUNG|nr:hypothetical protein PSACC_03175 [Paramicrosporidium saccamoebae]
MTATFRKSRVRARRGSKTSSTREDVATRTDTASSRPDFFTPPSPEPNAVYSFIEDWNRGAIPSNARILTFLNTWSRSPVLSGDSRLSPAGQALVADLRSLGDIFARVVKERNSDELLQRFVGHLRLAGRVIKGGTRSGRLTLIEDVPRQRRVKIFGRRDAQIRSEVSTRRQSVRQDARDLFSAAQLILASTDFRNVMMEVQKLVKRAVDLRQPSEPKVPNTERTTNVPSSTEPTTIDETELHKRLDKTAQEISDLRRSSPFTFSHNETSFRHSATFQEQSDMSRPSVEIYSPHGKRVDAKDTAPTTTTPMTSTLPTASTLPTSSTLPPTHTTPATPTEIDLLLDDARGLFRKLAGNKEFRKSISGIWLIVTKWQREASLLPGTVLPTDMVYDANFAAAQQDLLQLAERFAGGASLKPLLESINNTRHEALEDYELKDFLMDWRAFLKICTTDPDYLDHDEYRRRGRFLLERTTEYSESRYRALFQQNIDSWNSFLTGWQQDKLTMEIGSVFQRIVRDIFGQEGGILNLARVQSSLISDLRDVLLPSVLRSMYELPIPHVDIVQGPMHVSLDNIVLPAALFTPAVFDLQTRSSLHMTPRDRFLRGIRRRVPSEGRWRSGAHLGLTGMKGDIPNVQFALDRTTWPKIRDQGTCDVRFGGKGLSIDLDVATDISAAERRFHIEPVYVGVRVDRIALKFYNVQHDTFFALMKPYLQSMMKTRLERAMCDKIVKSIAFIDSMASRIAKTAV